MSTACAGWSLALPLRPGLRPVHDGSVAVTIAVASWARIWEVCGGGSDEDSRSLVSGGVVGVGDVEPRFGHCRKRTLREVFHPWQPRDRVPLLPLSVLFCC